MFYLHARLLERAAKLSKAAGGGSLTALPIAELDAGNLSAYIPTNLISITDGQIVLDARLFHEGHKPAIDVGTSVSRVGGKTQAPALREAAERCGSTTPSSWNSRCSRASAASRMPRSRARSRAAQRIRAILSQPQYAPLRLADEVALALALQGGLLDRLPLEEIGKFRSELPGWLDRSLRHRSSTRSSAPAVSTMPSSAELKTSLSALVTQLAPPPAASEPRTT